MNLFQAIIVLALVGNATLGLLVLSSNPRRAVNRAFFFIVALMTFWLASMFAVTVAFRDSATRFFVCLTSAFAGFLPLGAIVLQAAIVKPDITLVQVFLKSRRWLGAALAATALCLSPVFVVSSRALPGKLLPETVYGWGFPVYATYLAGAIALMALGFWNTAKTRTGVQKTEIHFLQIGCVFSLSLGIALAVLGEVLHNRDIPQFVPIAALVFDAFVGYGIATRRILSASAVLQRVIAYGLMTGYLAALYVAALWLGRQAFGWLLADPADLAHLLAALAVAFSVSPAHGAMQAVAHRLFATAHPLNVNALLEQAGAMAREVSTETNLMAHFADLVADGFGATRIVLLRPLEADAFVQAYPEPLGGKPIRLRAGGAIAELLARDRAALTVDTLHRMRSTPTVAEARETMKEIGAAVAVGSFMRTEMKAILLLFSKKSGRIYDLRDQRTLQLLCDQFAVALENANLYTAVQNSKIYNDILLDSLTSGIVAVDSGRRVTVFNQRAQGLTGLPESSVVNQPMTALPEPLCRALESILASQRGFRDTELSIRRGHETVPIRASGALFHSHTGKPLGALVAFDDLTLFKKMEEQIRRSDRLSSIGTLSAGMAHEIKNPLVTIKTFAKLLPQRHHEADFRDTFHELVGQEVTRIDTIVNRLLNFARPAPPVLKPVSLHGVLENSLHLVGPQLYQSGIELDLHLDAPRDLIDADAEQLNQTFVNFFLNAIQAMKRPGMLTVRTALAGPPPEAARLAGLPDGERIQVDVQDTGCGIAAENLDKIFDPFFTTKEHGVGLGLSVSHGIVREHGGTIEVESRKGQGTVFHVQFPLRRAVAA